ncbi:MAG: hypothetical protein KDC98_04040, partial [Planctomycetes bacterium]|nr:hypothetical protein [Planctomycetota bacterium]
LFLALTTVTLLAVNGWIRANEVAALEKRNSTLSASRAETAQQNENLAREKAEKEFALRVAAGESLLAAAEAAARRGDFVRALALYDEAVANGAIDDRRLAILRVGALDNARRYSEATELLATISGADDDANLQVLLADLGVDRLRDPLRDLGAASRALELDAESHALAPADRCYMRALLSDDPQEVLQLLLQARRHDPYHRRVNDSLGTTLLLMGQFEAALRFKDVLESIYPDDPQTWFYSLAVVGISGDEDAAQAILDQIGERFGREDARLAEMIYRAVALGPYMNEKLREGLSQSSGLDFSVLMRVVTTIVPLQRAIEDALPEEGSVPSGVAFLRTPPAIVNVYRPLWLALKGDHNKDLSGRLKAALVEIVDRSVEGTVPMIYAMLTGLTADRDAAVKALHKALTLPSGVLERRTLLLQGLMIGAALLMDDGLQGELRDTLREDVRAWVDEACDLPDKTAGEYYVIWQGADKSRSGRALEVVSGWRRVAPQDPAATLAFATELLTIGSLDLPESLVAAIDVEALPEWQRKWVGTLVAFMQRKRAEASARAAANAAGR